MVVNKSKAAFRTIAEVADELGVATHVLRFWETKFPQIKPMKRRDFLYEKRYTIEGVQKVLKEKGVKNLVGEEIQKDFFATPEKIDDSSRELISGVLEELKGLKNDLSLSLERISK